MNFKVSKINYRYLVAIFIFVVLLALAFDHIKIDLSALEVNSQAQLFTFNKPASFSYGDFCLKIVNFLFVIIVFFVAREDRISDQKKRDEDAQKKHNQDNNIFWFREFIIKPRREDIVSFFNSIEILCTTHCQSCADAKAISVDDLQNNIKKAIRTLNEKIQEFDQMFIQEISAIDENLSSEIRNELDALQDALGNQFSALPADLNKKTMTDVHMKCKLSVLKKLMSFNISH